MALYFNNNQKLVTTNDGVVVTGILTATGNLTLGATEFQLVDTGGYLHIRTNTGEDTAKFQKDGATFLYHNNNQKLVTSSNGVDVTGSLTVTEGLLHSGDTDTKIAFDTNTIKFETNTNERMRITSAGNVGIGSAAPLSVLSIGGGPNAARSSHPTAFISPTSGNASLMLRGNSPTIDFDSTGGGNAQVCTDNAALIVSAGTFEDTTLNAGEMVRIDATGRVLIGTTTEGHANADDLTIATSGVTGITIRSGSSSNGNIFFSDATSGAGEYQGMIIYGHGNDSMQLYVNGGTRLTFNSGGNATFAGIVTATEFIPTVSQLSHRNLIINGDCRIAQRGTSSSSAGYKTVDRFKLGFGGTDEAPTQFQGTLTSGLAPYAAGFRNVYYIINGDQTGGAGTSDYVEIQYKIEAQDIANSGWEYTSSSSFITLSFWVKSSVTQNFYGFIYSADGTAQRYIFETGTITANSWNKVVVTIPGGSNVAFDNNANEGLIIKWIPYYGTDLTNNSGTTLNTWANYNGGARTPDGTSTWYTTNNSTFWLTGVQLEVGSQATPFEHRSYADELKRCQRYYQEISRSSSNNSVDGTFASGTGNDNAGNGGILQVMVRFQTTMRTAPTMTQSGTFSHHVSGINVADTTIAFNQAYIDGIKITGTQTTFVHTDGFCGELISKYSDSSTASIKADAEL